MEKSQASKISRRSRGFTDVAVEASTFVGLGTGDTGPASAKHPPKQSMQQTELRPALAAQEGEKKEGRQERIQRDGGRLDGLREDYGVGQR